MLLLGSFLALMYGPLMRRSLHFLMWSSLSSTTVALPLSTGRMMMFSFYGRDFKDVDCFLVMLLSDGFALRMLELRSARVYFSLSLICLILLRETTDNLKHKNVYRQDLEASRRRLNELKAISILVLISLLC